MNWLNHRSGALKLFVLGAAVALLYAGYLAVLIGVSPISQPATAAAVQGQAVVTAASPAAASPAPTAVAAAPAAVAATVNPAVGQVASPVVVTVAPANAAAAQPTAPATLPATVAPTAPATLAATRAPTAVASPTPTTISLPTRAPTATAGPVIAGLAVGQDSGGGLRVQLRRAEGAPIGGAQVSVFRQITDVSGKPAFGERVANDSTANNTGRAVFELAPGTYALRIDGLTGYAWGSPFDIVVAPGAATVVTVTLGKMTVGIVDAEGRAVNHRVNVSAQVPDVNGNPTEGNRLADAETGSLGVASFDLTAGVYALRLDGPNGYLWGSPFNYTVSAGQVTPIVLKLARVTVGTTNVQGQPESKRVQVVTLQPDVNGRPAADRVVINDGTSRSTGLASFDLTAGVYALAVEGYPPRVITLEPGKVQMEKFGP